LDLIQIRYFLTLAKTLNFTRAAEICNVTQPALTKSIRRLESELGGPLLLRERVHTQLTPLGVAMRPLLQQTFDSAETARLGAVRFREQELALLRIGLGTWVDPSVLAPLIQEVSRRFPSLEVTVRQGDQTVLNEWLLGAEIDVLLTADVEHLALAAGDSLSVDQLRGQVLIGKLGADADEGRTDIDLRSRLALTAPPRHRGSSDEQVHNLVRAGIGIALSTERRVLPPGIARRAVRPSHALDVFVAALAGRPVTRAADAFLRLARARDWSLAAA
jgi:DNA-binding transcriptional LysR family regulator